MNKILSFFLPFYRHSFETTLSEERIMKKISEIEPYAESPYYSRVRGNHFIVGEQVIQSYYCGWRRNAFAPVFSAKIEKRGERVLVKATVSLIAFPINVIGAIAAGWELWPMFPMYWVMTMLMCLLFHFAFKRPSRKLVEHVEHLIYYDTEV